MIAVYLLISLQIIFFLALLIFSAEWLKNSAQYIGRRLGWSDLLIGALILAPVTSLPELVSSVFGMMAGDSNIVMGNVLGSNFANICLVLGFCAIFAKGTLVTKNDPVTVDVSLLVGSVVFLIFFGYDGAIDWQEGLIGIFAYGFYVFNSVKIGTLPGVSVDDSAPIKIRKLKLKWTIPVALIILVLSCGGVIVGGKYLVSSIIMLSEQTGYNTGSLSGSVVAIGTSLPELIVMMAVLRNGGDAGMAVGNVLGSNIFNILVAMTVPTFWGDVLISGMMQVVTGGVLLITILVVFVVIDRQVHRSEGVILLLPYIAYLMYIL